MRSRLLHVGIVFILVVCLVCPLVELFDHWDHTIQTGNDTEYTLVILALCAGVAYSLARFIVKPAPLGIVAKEIGRASCRERWCIVGWAEGYEKGCVVDEMM